MGNASPSPLNIQFQFAQHGFEVLRQIGADAQEAQLLEIAQNISGHPCQLVSRAEDPGDLIPVVWQQSDPTLAIILRLALDPCTFFDGALKLCPASHKHGLLTVQEIRGHSIRPFSSPELAAGDLLALHPLTIHAAAPASSGKPHRALHLCYGKI